MNARSLRKAQRAQRLPSLGTAYGLCPTYNDPESISCIR